MRRFLCVGLTALLIAAAPPSKPQPPKAGTYELALAAGPGVEMVYALIKITPKDDGALAAELVATSRQAPNLDVTGVTLTGDLLRIDLKNGPSKLSYEGRVPHKDADKVLGSLGDETRPSPATLKITEKTEIAANESMRQVPVPEPMKKAQQLSNKGARLRFQAQRATDAEEKAKLLKEAAEAEKEAAVEAPKLYREVVQEHADDPAALTAAMILLRGAGKAKVDPATVGRWAAVAAKASDQYGVRSTIHTECQIAAALVTEPAYVPVALEHAQWAEKLVGPNDPLPRLVHVLGTLARVQKKAGMADASRQTLARLGKIELDLAQKEERELTASATAEKQETVLTALAAAQRKTGMTAEAAITEARLAKMQQASDEEYLAKMPPFKPEAFAGRKEKSDRVVVMELFTGAQCPPCVAADVGFDALEKTYKPTDVVFLQYHLHIPGPDPLTNPTTEARANHYDVHSTPTTLFNGKKEASGGGGVVQSEKKYKEYREIIDKLLEEPAGATIAVDADRRGDTITVRAKVSDLEKRGEKMRLRLAVVEEAIRYVGGNKLRFHHMVVRTMPGGPDGFNLTGKETEHTATVKLDDLRQKLSDYLDDREAVNPFPKPDRPMALKHLKVIAFVQNDATGEILQAAMADVGGEHAAK